MEELETLSDNDDALLIAYKSEIDSLVPELTNRRASMTQLQFSYSVLQSMR